MANNYGVANTTFKPFSFEEMLKPALMATESHEKLEENLSNLEVIAGDLENKITNNPKDKKLKDLYNSYIRTLRDTSNLLSTKGLNAEIKKTFNNLKAQYSTNFGGVDEAYKALVAQNDYLNKLAVTNPEIIVEGAGDSLSDFMNGKSPKLKGVNLEDITNSVAKTAKTEALRNVRYGDWEKDAKGKLLTQVNKIGLSSEEFNKALSDYNKGNTDNPYAVIVGSLYELGIAEGKGLTNSKNLNRVSEAVIKGLQQGFAYSEDRKSIANPGYGKTAKPNNTPPKIDWGALNPHDVGYLGSENVTSEYLKLLQKLSSNSTYFGSEKRNPMAIYEEREKLRDEKQRFKAVPYSDSYRLTWNDKRRDATYDIVNKYAHEGLNSVLTPDEYEMLKTLGYTSDTPIDSFINYQETLDNAIKKYTPSRVANAKWDVFDDTLTSIIASYIDDGTTQHYMFENNKGLKGEGIKPKAAQKFSDSKVSDITYDAGNSDVIKIKTNKGSFFADPSIISAEAKNLVEAASYKINNTNDIQIISDTQEQTTIMLRNLLNQYFKVRGATDSNI